LSTQKISSAVINRLPRYYRYLGDLLESGITKISSKDLATKMGTTASQVRQDLNCFGGFGQQGYGYNVEFLHSEISSILGIDNKYKSIIIGMGKLGSAIVQRIAFEHRGFHVIGTFDIDAAIIGKQVDGFTVMDIASLEDFCRVNKPEIAFLTLPRAAAPAMSLKLEEFGIKAFWNFSSAYIKLNDPTIPVENVHLGDSLMTLCFRYTNRNKNIIE
jgi:redox-sensing transcriptional repressor